MRLDFLTKPLFRRTTLWIFQDYWNRIAFSRSFVFHGNPAEFLFRISSTGIFGIPTVFFFFRNFSWDFSQNLSRDLYGSFSQMLSQNAPKSFFRESTLNDFSRFLLMFFSGFHRTSSQYSLRISTGVMIATGVLQEFSMGLQQEFLSRLLQVIFTVILPDFLLLFLAPGRTIAEMHRAT